eukprot:UN17054
MMLKQKIVCEIYMKKSTVMFLRNLQELMTPELRLDALRILTSLCGIISYESQIQTLINLGVIRRFVELLSHSNNVIVYMVTNRNSKFWGKFSNV